jgi:hypothetical protein
MPTSNSLYAQHTATRKAPSIPHHMPRHLGLAAVVLAATHTPPFGQGVAAEVPPIAPIPAQHPPALDTSVPDAGTAMRLTPDSLIEAPPTF